MLDLNMSLAKRIFVYIVLILLAVILLAPFMYMISIALASPETNIKESFTLFPHEFYWDNFTTLFSDAFTGNKPIITWFFNTMICVIFGILGQLISCTLVAYGFAHIRYRHKQKFFVLMLSTMMLPGQITLIPVFYLFTRFGMYNTLWPLIIPAFFGSAYNIFFTRQFMTAIPGALYDAAEVDGLGPFAIYRRIVLPLIIPAMVAIAIFTFNGAWGDMFGPLIYISDTDKMTLALGATNLAAAAGPAETINMSVCMCMSFLLCIPQVVLYFCGQKQLFHINLGIGNSGNKG